MSAIDALVAETPPARRQGDVLGHPRGLMYLVFAETWERFSFYGTQALLMLDVGALFLALAIAASASAQTGMSPAAPEAKAPPPWIAGAWRLMGTRQRMTDGATRPDPDLGAHPVGYMMYDASGRMCTVFDSDERPRWASAPPTDAELRAMFDHMLVYCARYEVDESRGYIVYHLEIGQSPNTAGTMRERRFERLGDTLTLYPTPLPAGVVEWSISLQRVQP
ncbi:MAG: hypothetical protein JWO83_3414 [Caulobacteraceae bacterium]|nr:hypothetical protein [Caulobacteraceae bacterium]